MAIDLKLDDTYDITIEGGDLALVTEGEEVAQHGTIRLLFIQAEWFFDYTKGVDWFGAMFGVATSYEQKAKILKDTIKRTDGVNRLLGFEFGVDPVEHRAEVTFLCETNFGLVTIESGF